MVAKIRKFMSSVVGLGFLMLAQPAPAQTPEAPLRVRQIPIGGSSELNIPFYAPQWASGNTFRYLNELLTENQGEGARRALLQIAMELKGHRLLDWRPSKTLERWQRFAPAHEQLGAWVLAHHSVVAKWNFGRELENLNWPLNSGSPLLWWKLSTEQAQLSTSLAWETGSVNNLWLIQRAGIFARQYQQPPELRRVSEMQRWLGKQRIKRISNTRSPWRSTFPRLQSPVAAAIPVKIKKLYLRGRYHHELTPNPDHVLSGVNKDFHSPLRRHPLAAIYPYLGPKQAIIATGSELYSISTQPHFKRLWTLRPQPQGSSAELPALLVAPLQVTGDGPNYLATFRTHRTVTAGGSSGADHSINIIQNLKLDRLGYHQAHLYTAKTRSSHPSIAADISNLQPLLDKGQSLCGAPLWTSQLIILPTFRGFKEISIELRAFDRASHQLRWQRRLASRKIPWLSMYDLRNLLPEIRLDNYGGDLLVSSNLGLIARYGLENGDTRGAWRYPIHDYQNLAKHGNSRIMRLITRRLPEPRLRAPSIDRVVERKDQGPLWICLPPLAQHVIAINLDNWQIEWTVEAERLTHLLGIHNNELVLLDVGMKAGEAEVRLRRVALDGRHRTIHKLKLSAAKLANQMDLQPLSALLVGLPAIMGEELCIPTIAGLEFWSLTANNTVVTARNCDRILTWPSGAGGGTVYRIDEKTIIALGRGDLGTRRNGYFEVLSLEE